MKSNNKIIVNFCFIAFLIAGCKNNSFNCTDVLPNENFKGKGVLVYQQSSQDAHREIWFFPVCFGEGLNENYRDFSEFEFKKGISFRLPLTGRMYQKFSGNSLEFIDENYGNPQKIFYYPAAVEFNRPENSTYLYSKSGKDWVLNFSINKKKVQLNYFVSNESNLKSIEALR